MKQTHFQSPCIHCGSLIEDVAVGPCPGDKSKAIAIAYRALGVRWDGYEHFLVRMSTNEVVERWCHTSAQAPYRGFKMLGDIQQPPRYDPSLAHPSQDRSMRNPDTAPPPGIPGTIEAPCGNVAAWDYGSGNGYRCTSCFAVLGSIGMPRECSEASPVSRPHHSPTEE